MKEFINISGIHKCIRKSMESVSRYLFSNREWESPAESSLGSDKHSKFALELHS